MLLTSEIEKAYNAQKAFLQTKNTGIPRQYLENFQPLIGHVDVISGIRRCGKSTLMYQIIKKFFRNVAYFNFEDSRVFGFEVGDFQKLDEIIGAGKEAYFFDEIQNIPSWEIFVRQLHDRGEKIYITGSNASLLSRELGTRLTGRHLRHELFPFSYAEFLAFLGKENHQESFDNFLTEGGFPEYLQAKNPEVLQNLLKDIVFRDIAVRYGVRNSRTLMDLALFLISNIGKEVSYNGLKKFFEIGSANTVSDYLSWLEDAYLLFFLPKFSWSAKKSAVNPRKVYAIDNGLVKSNSLSFSSDRGRLLENLVFQFLRQKNAKIYFFREIKECDFVVFSGGKCLTVIQVCDEITLDNKTREMAGLMEAIRFFELEKGLIITRKQKDQFIVEGKKIEIIPACQFLLEWELD
jgi:predicted AAA+ superfamily ATPase